MSVHSVVSRRTLKVEKGSTFSRAPTPPTLCHWGRAPSPAGCEVCAQVASAGSGARSEALRVHALSVMSRCTLWVKKGSTFSRAPAPPALRHWGRVSSPAGCEVRKVSSTASSGARTEAQGVSALSVVSSEAHVMGGEGVDLLEGADAADATPLRACLVTRRVRGAHDDCIG